MTWNGVLKIHIFCTLVFITFCAGCFTTISDLKTSAEDYVDLSDPSADKAQLRAAKWDIGIAGVYCYMTAPAHAERVTLNAGMVDVSVVCETVDVVSGSMTDRVSFSFDALAGHDYVITKRDCDRCVKLKDLTTNKLVAQYDIPNNPLGRVADLSTGDNTAAIEVSSWDDGSWGCWLTDKYVDYLIVDAGTVTVDSTCAIATLSFNRVSKVRSSFHFEAETGHSYTVKLSIKDKCLLLRDITIKLDPTFEDINIACEPYEKVE